LTKPRSIGTGMRSGAMWIQKIFYEKQEIQGLSYF